MSNNIKSFLPLEPRRNTVVQNPVPSGKQAGPGRDPAAAGPAQEKVTLTEAARKLANLSAESAHGWPMNEARISQLRAAIESGQYRADPEAIAAALMRFEQEG
jgi:negative regulator of flagellin synthesis FlgM